MLDNFLVYENWRTEIGGKAVVHKSNCGTAKEGNLKITNRWLMNNAHPNDRWFGYFQTLESAISFATLLPNRKLKICKKCLKIESKEKKTPDGSDMSHNG